MWATIEIASSSNHSTFGIHEDGEPISNQQFLDLLKNSSSFRSFYNQQLAECSFPAFLWENNPITTNSLEQNYEYTLVDNHFLANRSPDRQTFAQYFQPNEQAVSFPNLGGDAQLIAPCPHRSPACYTHLGSFVRNAGTKQQDALWQKTGQMMLDAIGKQPRWLSTNGLGVFWLHIRIDRRPKYYQTETYKTL